MSKYDLFRIMNGAAETVESAKIANFIENSLSSTEIYHTRRTKDIKAVLTRDHKEGNIEIILFTYPMEGADKVIMGDYILHNNKNFLTFLEYDHPLSKHYHKFKILECNINIKVDDLELPAAYFSGMRSFINNTSANVQKSTSVFENMKPVVVVKDNEAFKPNFRFLAAGEAYRVINVDRISNPGIAYLSVEQTPLNRMTDDLTEGKVTTYETPVEPDVNPFGRGGAVTEPYKKGDIVTLDILNGFVLFSPRVEIITRTRDEITFKVPFDIENLKITTKDEHNNEIITEREVI